jgi:hypothetical protein
MRKSAGCHDVSGNRNLQSKRHFVVVDWAGGARAGGTGAVWGVVVVPGSYQAQPAPSWSKVIATTLRLWLQRRVLRVPDGPDARRLARRRALVAGLSVLVTAAAATAGVTLTGRHQAGGSRPAATARLSDAALAAAAANRELAATWIAAQVSRGVIVACDPLMCADLQHDGFPAADLESLGAGSGDPLGSAVVVATAALRSELGPRLASVYAPVVLATFGRGPSAVDVRVTAPDGGAAYVSAARADLLARQQDGDQLLHNANVHVPAAGQAELAAGQVDSRLLITLAALANSVPVYIRQFGDAGPGAAAGTPMRSMTISAAPLPHGATYLADVLAFLRAQRAPFLATATVSGTGTAAVLQIVFTAPSPLGLLAAQTPK